MSKDGNLYGAMGRAGVMGLHFVTGTFVGGGMGYGIDHWLDSAPWGLLIGLVFGIVAGFRNMWLDAKKLLRHE